MAKIEGGCLCGAVRYATDAEMMMPSICHCKNCQRQSGSAYSLLFGVPKEGLAITGADHLKTYEDTGESGNPVWRKFCPTCGSPVFTAVPHMPDGLFIKAGTLDDISLIEPQMEFWVTHKHKWLQFGADLPGFPQNPEG